MWQARAYWRVIATGVKQEGANPQRIVVSVLQMLGRLLLIFVIYQVAYTFNPNPGMQFANALWSISVFFAFVLGLDLRSLARTVDTEVKHGTVETGITKPLDWRLVKVCEHVGRNGIEFLVHLVILPLLLLWLVGLPNMAHATPLFVLAELACIVLAVITVASLFLLVGLSAFWLNDAMPLYRIVDKAAAVFCGSFVPFALLPPVLQDFIIWSPFGIYSAPQQIFNPAMRSIIGQILISGVLWTAAMLAFCAFVWHRVQRRIEVNGG